MNSDSRLSHRQADNKASCDIDIHIQNTGDVHIYNCSPPAPTAPCVETPPPPCPPEEVFGICIPAVAGAKHKLGRDFKIKQLAETVRVPSAIASSTIHMARRFLLGKTPANAIEAGAFSLFDRISREMMSCTVAAFDAIPADQGSRLFADSLQLDPDQAIDQSILVTALAQEIKQRIGVQVFDNPAGRLRLLWSCNPELTALLLANGERALSISC